MMIDFFFTALAASWQVLTESAPYVLFGFLAAGLLKAFLPEEAMARHLGNASVGAVLKASLIGIPLPLCSCGVIPAAVGLRRQGASKGASVAFLVSTPESGVDSIALTWVLLDPVMAVLRPLAAFVTATVTGLLINHLPEEAASPYSPATAVSAASCGCGGSAPEARPSLARRFRDGVVYACDDLLGDIGRWLLLGIAIAGVISALLPDAFFARMPGGEWGSLLAMLAFGIPMYICASASTPVAAALVLKGVSPGAALVFLLVGPATNAATIAVVSRFWGRRAVVVYLGAIASCSLLLGWLTNRLYQAAGLDITRWVARSGETPSTLLGLISAILLLLLLGRKLLPRLFIRECCGSPSGEG